MGFLDSVFLTVYAGLIVLASKMYPKILYYKLKFYHKTACENYKAFHDKASVSEASKPLSSPAWMIRLDMILALGCASRKALNP